MDIANKFRTFAGLAGLVFLLGGCNGQPNSTPTIPLETNSEIQLEKSQRFRVKLVSKFEDNLAYGGKRGIYEIIDSQTGKIYIGVSGIGITEKGSHKSGKSSVTDER